MRRQPPPTSDGSARATAPPERPPSDGGRPGGGVADGHDNGARRAGAAASSTHWAQWVGAEFHPFEELTESPAPKECAGQHDVYGAATAFSRPHSCTLSDSTVQPTRNNGKPTSIREAASAPCAGCGSGYRRAVSPARPTGERMPHCLRAAPRKHDRQILIEQADQNVVVRWLVTALHTVLGDPVGESADKPRQRPKAPGEDRRVEDDEDSVVSQGDDGPPAPVPPQPEAIESSQRAHQNGEQRHNRGHRHDREVPRPAAS